MAQPFSADWIHPAGTSLALSAGLEVAMKRFVAFFVASALSAVPAAAKPHRHESQPARCYFQPHDIRITREYYAPRSRSLPPGLAKKFARTGHLPPGWQKKVEPLPVFVERQLVVLPPGYRRGYIDGSVVVYSPRRGVTIDVVALMEP